jgi:DNA mismatch endonuclease, patch repair protein
MASIRGRDTAPELRLRSALHRMGLRYRLCRMDLPGRPDIVFVRQRIAIQVRGCFWHQHKKCESDRQPRTNLAYWKPKLEGNVRRDKENDKFLRALGWSVIVVWECELKKTENIEHMSNYIARRLEK